MLTKVGRRSLVDLCWCILRPVLAGVVGPSKVTASAVDCANYAIREEAAVGLSSQIQRNENEGRVRDSTHARAFLTVPNVRLDFICAMDMHKAINKTTEVVTARDDVR